MIQPVSTLSPFAACVLDEERGKRFLRNLRAVDQVRAGVAVREVAAACGIGRSTLGRLVQRTRALGQVACVPHATYQRERALHPAFQEAMRQLDSPPTRLSMRASAEHAELTHVASR